jgi:hypothetical protein
VLYIESLEREYVSSIMRSVLGDTDQVEEPHVIITKYLVSHSLET